MPDQDLLFDGPEGASSTVVLAHGAGAPMDSPFLSRVAAGLASRGVRVARFEFPYMQRRRRTGSRSAPDRLSVLEERWREVVGRLGGGASLFLGGKSLGGRIASMVADELGARGLVCLGYPFHPPGKPERMRTAHLEKLRTPALIVQGTRDPFGSREDVAGYGLSAAIRFHWIEDGDHSFKPPARSSRSEKQNFEEAIEAVSGFLRTPQDAGQARL
jgi:predicted alpha/beta-hydrolase family hydrolase